MVARTLLKEVPEYELITKEYMTAKAYSVKLQNKSIFIYLKPRHCKY